jgi:tight adherence protein B
MISEAKTIRQYAELVRAGHRIQIKPEQFSKTTVQDLNQILELTAQVGGQLAATLDRFATVLLTREQNKTELELAVAGPKASSRLVMSLPILVFVGSGIAGIPIFEVLRPPSIVWLSLLLGLLLFWLGTRWTNRLMARAEPRNEDPGITLELLAIAVKAGLPLRSAAETVGATDTSELQQLAAGSGIALYELIIERANSLRLDQFNRDRMRIQKTSVSVLWPLGLTVLPAFVLLAIIPVGAALIQNN